MSSRAISTRKTASTRGTGDKSRLEEDGKMPDCELLHTCPFFNDMKNNTGELATLNKESYCRGSYTWCGRYMAFKALEREINIINSAIALVYRSNLDQGN